MLELVAFLSFIVSLSTGSLSIALISLYHQNEAVLMVLACSTIIYSITVIVRLFLFLPINQYLIKFSNIFFQLLTLASSVEYFNETTKRTMLIQDALHNRLIIAFQSLLIFSLFINGVFEGCDSTFTTSIQSSEEFQDDEEKLHNLSIESDRFVPLKNSAQTLTPEMANITIDPEQKFNWIMNELNKKKVSDDISNSSVLKHQLTTAKFQYRSRSATTTDDGSKIKKRSLKFKSQKLDNMLPLKLRGVQSFKNDGNSSTENKSNVNARYVTRLSIISDLPRNFLNLLTSKSINEVNTTVKMDRPLSVVMDTSNGNMHDGCLQNSKLSESPQMMLERDAIDRIDCALLPSFLNIRESLNTKEKAPSIKTEISRPISPLIPQNEINEEHVNETNTLDILDYSEQKPFTGGNIDYDANILDHDDLGNLSEISEISDLNFDNDSACRRNEHLPVELPSNVTLDMWERDKNKYLERASSIKMNQLIPMLDSYQTKEIDDEMVSPNATSPAFQTKPCFSFPSKQNDDYSVLLEESRSEMNSDSDIVGELDKYLNELDITEEASGHLLEESFRHDYSASIILEKSLKDLRENSTKHSPTKSLVSIMSSGSIKNQKSQNMLNSFLRGSSGHTKSNSQVNFRFPITGSTITSVSTQSSPIKSNSFKRFGKKLSISNSNDTFSHSHSNSNQFETYNSYQRGHDRGKSVDFTYIRSIQSQHSPTKSISTTASNTLPSRRSSTIPERTLRTVSRLLYAQHVDTTYKMTSEDVFNTTFKDNDVISSRADKTISNNSASDSQESENEYPDVVLGEYDREKWNALQNLHLINSKGEIIGDTHV